MRSLRFWASVVVSVILLWIAFRGQSFTATWDALRSAEYWYLVPAIALYFLGVWVRTVRWKALLSPLGRFPVARLFPVVVIGYMANDVLPARMGELVRVYVLAQRHRVSKTSALGTVVVERLLDAVTMLMLLAAAGLMVPLNGAIERVALVTSAVLLAGVVCLLVLALAPGPVVRVVLPLLDRVPGSLRARFHGLGSGFASGLRVVRHPRALAFSFGLSVSAWVLEAGMYWMIARAFDLHIGAAAVLLTLAVANLATLIPAAPGYVGSFELGALLVLSGLLGLTRELATGYVLVVHAALVFPVTLLGLYYWGSYHLSLYRIRRDPELSRRSQARIKANAVD